MDPSTVEKVPIDQLAQLESDHGILFLGTLPLAFIAVLAVICAIVYFVGKSKNWNELGEAMRIDDGDKPVNDDGQDTFHTMDLADADGGTKPSQHIPNVSRVSHVSQVD